MPARQVSADQVSADQVSADQVGADQVGQPPASLFDDGEIAAQAAPEPRPRRTRRASRSVVEPPSPPPAPPVVVPTELGTPASPNAAAPGTEPDPSQVADAEPEADESAPAPRRRRGSRRAVAPPVDPAEPVAELADEAAAETVAADETVAAAETADADQQPAPADSAPAPVAQAESKTAAPAVPAAAPSATSTVFTGAAAGPNAPVFAASPYSTTAPPTTAAARRRAVAMVTFQAPDPASLLDTPARSRRRRADPETTEPETTEPASGSGAEPVEAGTADGEPDTRTGTQAAVGSDDTVGETGFDGGDDGEDGDGSGSGSTRRRRRGRRGRGRRDPDGELIDGSDADGDEGSENETGSRTAAEADETAAATADDLQDDTESSGSGSSRRRRRRRRRGSADDTVVAPAPDDPPNTVVHVRQAPRSTAGTGDDQVRGVTGSTRLEAKRQRRREGRDSGRRRAPIVTEAEFLARRESVERRMVVRNAGDRTQIAVLEDGVLVEHFVTRASSASYAGNVYLGRVQNVLASMEAAFVDIGKGRNAVLYAGEVNYDASGLEGRPRKIEQALKSGQSVLVQVSKDPMGHKGARLTSQVSLPGRYLVYVPDGQSAGISRKLPDVERARLKSILKKITPEDGGVIVRTAAEGASEAELERDIERLAAQWEDIERKAAKASAPSLLYGEPDLVVRVIRDVFNEDFAELVVQGWNEAATIEHYVSTVAPDLMPRVRRYSGTSDVFAEYRVDEQLAKALDRKVYLPSGGSLVIDRTEAMTVVDVNTGKFTGKGGNLEETVTKNNLEAAEEIVRQLRLRDIGGIIVIDFIDMVLESNRELVLRRLTECLGRDRTRHQVAEVTSLGLVQMTRKRVGQGLLEAYSEPCVHCNGRGVLIHLDSAHGNGGTVAVPSAAVATPLPAPPRKGGRAGRGVAAPSAEAQTAAGATADAANQAVEVDEVDVPVTVADVRSPDGEGPVPVAASEPVASDAAPAVYANHSDPDSVAHVVTNGRASRGRTSTSAKRATANRATANGTAANGTAAAAATDAVPAEVPPAEVPVEEPVTANVSGAEPAETGKSGRRRRASRPAARPAADVEVPVNAEPPA